MTRMVYAQRFVDDVAQITSDRVYGSLRRTMAAIEAFPRIGSSDVPESVRTLFGDRVRKAVVNPFDVVYEYDDQDDTVLVYALIACKRAK